MRQLFALNLRFHHSSGRLGSLLLQYAAYVVYHRLYRPVGTTEHIVKVGIQLKLEKMLGLVGGLRGIFSRVGDRMHRSGLIVDDTKHRVKSVRFKAVEAVDGAGYVHFTLVRNRYGHILPEFHPVDYQRRITAVALQDIAHEVGQYVGCHIHIRSQRRVNLSVVFRKKLSVDVAADICPYPRAVGKYAVNHRLCDSHSRVKEPFAQPFRHIHFHKRMMDYVACHNRVKPLLNLFLNVHTQHFLVIERHRASQILHQRRGRKIASRPLFGIFGKLRESCLGLGERQRGAFRASDAETVFLKTQITVGIQVFQLMYIAGGIAALHTGSA